MKKVIIYIRVSTTEQIEGYSIGEQKARLLAYCKSMNFIVVDIIIDAGYSGSNLKRPGIQRIIEICDNKDIDAVVVLKLDRLSRSQRNTMYLIEDVFLGNDIDFISIQESFDTSSAFGRAMVGILSVFAQLELETIRDRTMSGRVGRAKNKKWHGGGSDPIGYDYIDGELVINETEAEQVRMVYELYAAGHTVTDITYQMKDCQTKHGDWSHTQTVSSVLDNELYNGTIHFKEVRTPDSHTAIVDSVLFKRVQHMRERNRKDNFNPKESNHLLTGLLYCGRCGARYFAKKKPNGDFLYCCHSRAKVNKKMVKDPKCKNDNYSKELLESMVNAEMIRVIENPLLVNEIIKKGRAEENDSAIQHAPNVQEEIGLINQEIDSLMDLYKYDRMPVGEIAEKIDLLHQKKISLSPSLAIREKENKDFHIESVKLLLHNLKGCEWSSFDIKKKRHIIRQVIDRIEITGREVIFKWSFV